jgi:hypothetical protein
MLNILIMLVQTLKGHLSAGTFFPLGRSAQNFVERASPYTGSTGSFVPVTITEIRNGATYIAIFSGVLGNVSVEQRSICLA